MRNRITIQTTEEFDSVLEQIRIATGRATKSDVLRDSLELFDLIVQHFVAGERLYLGMTRDSAGEVLLPHLERAAGRLVRAQLTAVPQVPAAHPVSATGAASGVQSTKVTAQAAGTRRAKTSAPANSSR